MSLRLTVPAGRLKKFRAFLESRGAEIVSTSNPYEVLRFRGHRGHTGVVYKRERSAMLTLTGEAIPAFKAFEGTGSWRVGVRNKRKPMGRKIAALRQRDGDDCFFCGKPIPEGEESIEHLVPFAHRGPNHLSNLALTHHPCNQEAGNLSVVEKVVLRDRMRGHLPCGSS